MRCAEVSRKTKEVEVEVKIDLDGDCFRDLQSQIDTGVPFLDHLLENFAKHSGIKLSIKAKGDIEVDEHHTIEDVAIALGSSIKKAFKDKKGISRFGDAIVPMDDAVSICAIDLSGRGYFNFEGNTGDVKGVKEENFIHFLDTLCRVSGINMYLKVNGRNSHHIMESAFKAFALSFKKAKVIEYDDIPSTKGVID